MEDRKRAGEAKKKAKDNETAGPSSRTGLSSEPVDNNSLMIDN